MSSPGLTGQLIFLEVCRCSTFVLYTAAMIQAHLPIPYFHTFSPIQQFPLYTSHNYYHSSTFAPTMTPRPNLPHHLTPGSLQSNITWLPVLDKTRPIACMLYLNKPRQRYSLAFLFLLTSQKNRTLTYNICHFPFVRFHFGYQRPSLHACTCMLRRTALGGGEIHNGWVSFHKWLVMCRNGNTKTQCS